MQTVETLVDAVCARFSAAGLAFGHGTDNAWDEACALVLFFCGHPDDESSLQLPITPAQLEKIEAVVLERINNRCPMAHILGRSLYRGLEFVVRPGVVVPRSPIGFVLPEQIALWHDAPPKVIIDLCAGSGCLGILASYIYPESEVTLVELDPIACDVARENIALHGLQERVRLLQGDVTQVKLPPADLVLCNPPYVAAVDMQSLPQEYRHEPQWGLAAGSDGLDVIKPLIERLGSLLNPQGIFIGEVGASAPALIAAMPRLPLIWLDLPDGGEGVFLLEAAGLTSHT